MLLSILYFLPIKLENLTHYAQNLALYCQDFAQSSQSQPKVLQLYCNIAEVSM